MTTRHNRLAQAGAFPALLLLLTACTTAPSPRPTATGTSGASVGPTVGPTGAPSIEPSSSPAGQAVRVYFMLGSFTGDGGLVPVLRTVPPSDNLGAATMAALLAGPNDTELGARPAMYTAIPDGARVTDVEIRGNSATVFEAGDLFPGSPSPTTRQGIAQIVYTLTQFPGIEFVFFRQAGPAPVGRPATRDQYQDLLPPVWVDQPAWGDVLPSGAEVAGLANAFEAQFQLMVLDAGGRALTDMPVMATCGTGCWGTFSVPVTYTVSAGQWGTLRVFEPSAKDGTPTHVVEYPVWLTP